VGNRTIKQVWSSIERGQVLGSENRTSNLARIGKGDLKTLEKSAGRGTICLKKGGCVVRSTKRRISKEAELLPKYYKGG